MNYSKIIKTKRGESLPTDFVTALNNNLGAREAFEAMPPSHQHEYLEVILEAKKPETRLRRIDGAIKMIIEWGKSRKRKT